MNRWLAKLQKERLIGQATADEYLEEFVTSVCFELLRPVSEHVVANSSRGVATAFYGKCDVLLKNIKQSVAASRKCKTFEEFKEEVLRMPTTVLQLVKVTTDAHIEICRDVEKEQDILLELDDSLHFVYDRYYDKSKDKKKRKRRKDAGKQRIVTIAKRSS